MDFQYNHFPNELHRPLPLLNDGRMLQQANCRDGARTEYWHAAAHQPRKLRPDANEWRVHRQDRNIFTNAKKLSLAQGLDQTGELESDSFTHTGTCAQDAHVTLSRTGAEASAQSCKISGSQCQRHMTEMGGLIDSAEQILLSNSVQRSNESWSSRERT